MTKRFFWFKFKTGFFDIPNIKYISKKDKGSDYIILWLRLCLLSITSTEPGVLKCPEHIEWNKWISSITGFELNIVNEGFEEFKKLGMLIQRDNRDYYIESISELVGSETKEAERKRKSRGKKQKETFSDNVT